MDKIIIEFVDEETRRKFRQWLLNMEFEINALGMVITEWDEVDDDDYITIETDDE